MPSFIDLIDSGLRLTHAINGVPCCAVVVLFRSSNTSRFESQSQKYTGAGINLRGSQAR
jgi:hypothetical protein